MPNTLEEINWEHLLSMIQAGKCTPFLGAGACHEAMPLAADIAQEWARDNDYPLEDPCDLTRVAQFLAVTTGDYMWPKERIAKQVKSAGPPDYTALDEPHGLLADLPLPVYITTNYDDFMVQALKGRGKHPRQELCRWNRIVKQEPSAFESATVFEPDLMNPVVFHLHGHSGVTESMVLTEDDYLDFLVAISREPELLPLRIQKAIGGTSLLFMGYRIADWNFRVLFRSIVGYLERSLIRAHVSVQLEPVGKLATDEQREKARKYLDRYFGELKIRMYWGTCREFTAELRRRWEVFSHGK